MEFRRTVIEKGNEMRRKGFSMTIVYGHGSVISSLSMILLALTTNKSIVPGT